MVEFHLDKDRCKGCELCIMVCPRKNLRLSKDLNKRGIRYAEIKDINKCTACGLCFLVCPDACIEIYEK